MHPYATDSSERTYIPFFLAGLAIVAAWGTALFLRRADISIPWWADAPSAFAFYGVFYKLFDLKMWRLPLLRQLRIVRLPVLEGQWRGELTTSFDEHASRHGVEVRIQQSWTRIIVSLRGKDSNSYSVAATLLAQSPEGAVLSYQYRNEPLPHAKETMQIHYGTAKLVLSDTGTLDGEYYSGRGRENFGAIHLQRT